MTRNEYENKKEGFHFNSSQTTGNSTDRYKMCKSNCTKTEPFPQFEYCKGVAKLLKDKEWGDIVNLKFGNGTEVYCPKYKNICNTP